MNQDVEQLRERLRSLGYLSSGMERWFALDPWSSRTFWSELVLVCGKAALLIAPFLAAPAVVVMALRNRPLAPTQVAALAALYLFGAFVMSFVMGLATALLLKLRPELAIRSTRFLNALSIALSGVLLASVGVWWFAFDDPPLPFELALGTVLFILAFLVSTTVYSAALLSLSIHESRQIPERRRASRLVPFSIASAVLIVLLLIAAYPSSGRSETSPPQIPTTQSDKRLVLIAVDGLTDEVLAAAGELRSSLPAQMPLERIAFRSPPERWASVGSGTKPESHRVRALEGMRIRGTERVLQNVSHVDLMLKNVAPLVGLAQRQPLPPTARERDYAWEIVAARGISTVAADWWATDDRETPTLWSVGQEQLFAQASKGRSASAAALEIDRTALSVLSQKTLERSAQFATVYLPALDIVLNRLELDSGSRVASSIRVLSQHAASVAELRRRGYEVILIGLPSEGQGGKGVLLSSLPLRGDASLYDVAPTVLDLLGFPKSEEMPGRSLNGGNAQPQIPTYGSRQSSGSRTVMDEDYYESLRSLGYIQ